MDILPCVNVAITNLRKNGNVDIRSEGAILSIVVYKLNILKTRMEQTIYHIVLRVTVHNKSYFSNKNKKLLFAIKNMRKSF